MTLKSSLFLLASFAVLSIARPAAADCSVRIENNATTGLMVRGPNEDKDIQNLSSGNQSVTIPKGQKRTFQVRGNAGLSKTVTCSGSEEYRILAAKNGTVTIR